MTTQRPRSGAAGGADDRGRPSMPSSTTPASTTHETPAEHPIEACPSFVAAMSIIGQRWSGLIIQALAKGCTSFTDVSHFAQNLSDASLSRRLKQLESEGLIVRTVSQERPVKVRYDLTDAGRALAPVLNDITEWGERFVRHGDVVPPERRGRESLTSKEKP